MSPPGRWRRRPPALAALALGGLARRARALSVLNFQQLGEQMMMIMQTTAQRKMPADWSLCVCEFFRNEWLHVAAAARGALSTPALRQAQGTLAALECPGHTAGGYWRAREKYSFDSTPEMVAHAWMPEHRATLADTCVAGHLVLMLLCSQHFLLQAEDGDQASLQAFFSHLEGVATLLRLGTGDGQYEKENAHILDVTRCLPTSVFPVDGNALRTYVQRWLGHGPQVAYLGSKLNVAAMRFTQSYTWRRETIPFKERPCVPFKDPLCFPRSATYGSDSCTMCCSFAGPDPACFDHTWTYERCCQRDFEGLHCTEIRHGEEKGQVADAIDFECLPIEEHHAKEAERRLSEAEEAVPRQERAAQSAGAGLAVARQRRDAAAAALPAARGRAERAAGAREAAAEAEAAARGAAEAAAAAEAARRAEREARLEAAEGPRGEAAAAAARAEELLAERRRAEAEVEGLRSRHSGLRRTRASEGRGDCLREAAERGRRDVAAAAAAADAQGAAVEKAGAEAARAGQRLEAARAEATEAEWALDLARRLQRTVEQRRDSLAGLLRWLRDRLRGGAAGVAGGPGVQRRLGEAEAAWEASQAKLQAAQSGLEAARREEAEALSEQRARARRVEEARLAGEEATAACGREEAPESPKEAEERATAEAAAVAAGARAAEAEQARAAAEETLRPLEEAVRRAEAELAAAGELARSSAAARGEAERALEAASTEQQAASTALEDAERHAREAEEGVKVAQERLASEEAALEARREAVPAARAALEAAREARLNARLYGSRHRNASRPKEVELVGIRGQLGHEEL